MGITPDRRILGHAASSGSIVSNQLLSMTRSGTKGIFIEIPMCASPEIDDDRACLIRSLKHIHEKGWIDSKQLSGDGTLTPCNSPQCGGFTLEAELGISKNSLSEPDYHGWEIKQHHVSSFERLEVGIITLMTPEPDGGQYANEGPEQFLRKFGYPDKNGRADRHNFGGLYRVGVRNPSTRLTLNLIGYSREKNSITDPGGSVSLMTDEAQIAASWGFGPLLRHWNRKHAKAAYIPSLCRDIPNRQYHFGDRVRLAVETDFMLLLRAFSDGTVYYDPGIKLENASSNRPKVKRRSQFRTKSKDVGRLYDSMEIVML